MLGVPCVPPFLLLPLVFCVWPSYLINCLSVSLQHFKLYGSLCFFPSLIHLFCMIPHSVMLYPVLFCFLTVFLPFYFLFSVFPALSLAHSSLTGKSKPQWSQPKQKPLQAAGLITPQQKLLSLYSRHVFWTERTKVGSLWSRSCPLESQLSHTPGDSAFPKAKSLIYSEFPISSIVTEHPKQSLLFIPPIPRQYPLSSISEATFRSTSNSFSSATAQSFLLFPVAYHKLSGLLSLLPA